MTATYDVQNFEKRLEMELLDGSKAFSVEGTAKLQTTSSYLTINVFSPIPNYETLSVHSEAIALPGGPRLSFELVKNNESIEVDLEINASQQNGKAIFEMTTPFTINKHVLLSAEYQLQDNPIRFKATAERDSLTRTIEGSVKLGDTERERCRETTLIVGTNDPSRRSCREISLDALLTTPLHGLERLSVKGVASVVNTACQSRLVLDLGGNQVTTEASIRLGWSSSEVSVHVSTPFSFVRTFGMNATFDIGKQTKTASVTMLKDNRHFMWLTSGNVQSGTASGYMTVFTPFTNWKSVNYSAMYNVNQPEKQVDISYERNGKKYTFSTQGFYNASFASLSAITPFKGFETLGVSGQYVNNRAKREIGYDTHVNEDRHRLYVLYEREGRNNIKLKLNTPIRGMHAVTISLRRESFSDGRGMYFDMNADGNRTSVEIRTVLAQTTMGIDITHKSDSKEFEDVRLSGSVNLAKRKKAFRLKSESKKQKIEFSGFYALTRKGGIGKLVSKLPIPGLKKVNVRVKITTGRKNKLLLTYSAGGKRKKINGDLTFTNNGLNINLKTPYNGFQRIQANAGRTTGADGRVSAELSLKRNNREIAVSYAYIFSMKSGDGSIEISTPYEGFEDMRMSLIYNNRANGRDMKFNARRNSREWSLETSKSWTDGAVDSSLVLSSPIESIRSLKVHRSFDINNLAAMTYHASYERNNRKFAISGEGSIQKRGKQLTLKVNVDTPLEIGKLDANVSYDFSRVPMSLNAGITADAKYMQLSASLGRPTGSIRLTTSHPALPSVDIAYTADITFSSEDVSAVVTLADGRRLVIAHKMTFGPTGRDGSFKVESSTYGNRELIWSYVSERRRNRPVRYSVSANYESPDVQGNFAVSVVQLTSYLHRNINASFSLTSESLTKNVELDSTINLENLPDVNAAAVISVDGRQYKLVINREKARGERTLNISFDGQRIQALRVIGAASAEPGALEGQRSITITYGRGRQQISVTGKLSLGASGKSGSLEFHVRKPTGGRTGNKDTRFKTSWSFIQPNNNIQADLSVDGRSYVAKVTGSRRRLSAEYVLELGFPSIRVARRKSVSEAVVKVAYDLNDVLYLKLEMDQPLEGKAEISFKKSQAETVFSTLLSLHDFKRMSQKIDRHNFELTYRRRRTSTGTNIQLGLDTSAFDLGKVDVTATIQRTSTKSTIHIEYNRGTKSATISGEISRSPRSGRSAFRLTTPIVGFEDVSLSGGYQYSQGSQYSVNLDYSRAGKHLHLDASSTVSRERATTTIDTRITVSSLITKPIEFSLTANVALKNLGKPNQSLNGKLDGALNGKKVGLTYTVDRDEHGRRIANAVLTTPLRNPYKKIVVKSDVSLHSNRAELSAQAGSKKLSGDVSWLAGEAGQYGVEISLSTPYAALKSLELEVRGTLNRDRSVDVLGHYQRNGVVVHVTGTVRLYAVDLIIEGSNIGKLHVEGNVEINRADRVYSVRGLVTNLVTDMSGGGEVTVKATALNDMQLTVDLQLPSEAWRRFNAVVAFTSLDAPYSRVLRIAFESPWVSRSEVSLELTNQSDADKTDLRAGATFNFRSLAFAFWTHIYRDSSGMKYELEVDPPYQVELPFISANY